ncbi:MAG: tRNA 5-hydroxyuridine modification protein YegQ [Pseudomonadales bacterium]
MKTELLSPAGSLRAMRYAFAYGADAVYAGQPRYSLRVRENEFNKMDVMAAAIEEAHNLDKLFFIASNLSPHNNKVKTYLRDMADVVAMKPDAFIMSDPGLIAMVKETWPDQEIHLSVQSNAVNFATVKFWKNMGISRVILSRELSLDEIAEIRQECPDIELEVFVHGALCMAYSGRCLLSGYINHRDSNQGACTNACRWKYQATPAEETAEGNIQANMEVGTFEPKPLQMVLQDVTKPDEIIPAYEDETGTYFMNSKDLRAIQHVERLMNMGIDSLKIEGRTKTYFYAARTAQAYRRAIDDAAAGRPFNMELMDDLESLANRGYTEGFYRRHVPGEMQNYENGSSKMHQHQFVGDVTFVKDGWATIEVKNKFCVGDVIEVMTPKGNHKLRLTAMRDKRGDDCLEAKGSGHIVTIPWPAQAHPEHAMILRELPMTKNS